MSDSDDESQLDRQLKVTLVGDGTAGKTSICVKLAQEQFGSSYKQTVGLDFFLKRISLPGNVNATIQVWDIGGQQLGGKMIDTYLFGAKAIFLVYDITNLSSFENLRDWLDTIHKAYLNQQRLPYLVLIANKVDLEHMRTVRRERHVEFAQENAMASFSLSAKTGDQIDFCFKKVAADLLGIKLTKAEVEMSKQVVKADIVNYGNQEAPPRAVSTHTKSTFCSIQ